MQSPPAGILSLMTFLPLIGALIVMFLPRPKDLPEAHGHGGSGQDAHEPHGEPEPETTPEPTDVGRLLVNSISLTFAVLAFLVSLALFAAYDIRFNNLHVGGIGNAMQFVENFNWIPLDAHHSIRYHLGVDGISLLLVLLTTFLMVLCVLFSFRTKQRLKEFMVFLLLLETGMIGVFCALDLVLFYIFFEAMLIPMYFLIGIFGHENRIYAAIKFFIYTFAGSVFMLIAIVAVYSVTGSFDIVALSSANSQAGMLLHSYGLAHPMALVWMFAAFSLAFAIKVPMFPFHTWLPDAHVEAPTAGSVILAGVMLKMGTYGFVRIVIPLFREQAQDYAPLFITLAIIGIIYGSIVAAVQPDAKKLVAYSSVAHLGFVILGIFTFTRIGMMGALVQNINHGISTPMLFFLVGMMYERKHTREISQYGGLKKIVPMMATMLLIATLASVAVPFFNGFVGEFPVLLGSWISDVTYQFGGYWPTALAATGMILSAVYMLWWYQRLMLGPITHAENRRLPDLTRAEWAVLLPLAAIVFWFGLGSNFWTQRMDVAVNLLLPQISEQIDQRLPIAQVIYAERNRTELGMRSRPPSSMPARSLLPGRRMMPRVAPVPGGPAGIPRTAPVPGGSTGAPLPGGPARMPLSVPPASGNSVPAVPSASARPPFSPGIGAPGTNNVMPPRQGANGGATAPAGPATNDAGGPAQAPSGTMPPSGGRANSPPSRPFQQPAPGGNAPPNAPPGMPLPGNRRPTGGRPIDRPAPSGGLEFNQRTGKKSAQSRLAPSTETSAR